MPEAGFPGQHTTTTTITTSTSVQTGFRFDSSYVRTAPGILKVIQVAASLLGFICAVCSNFSFVGKVRYFMWISMIAFWFTGILLCFYLFHIVERFSKIPWLKMEFGFTALWAPLYLLAAILATTVGDDANYAASFFGFCATAAYALDAYLKWRAVRSGGLAQGSVVVSVSKQTTTTVPVREGY